MYHQMSQSWVALYTKPNQEGIALENVRRQSYNAYCPMIVRTVRHARRTKKVKRPLFSGYVFVGLDTEVDQWRPLLSTRGVQSLVCFGSHPGELPSGFVEQLQEYEKSGVLEALATPDFKPGDLVSICDGPFRDFIARVVSHSDNERVWLLLDMMGREVKCQQPVSVLERHEG